ncbi:MAG TPA: helix-turn-helix domain-containing protein [Beijerinckiaceae bacterium]|jgi:predicted transcriptional regulator
MPLDQFQTLLRMLVEPILEEIWPDESGAARVQQVGLFTLIFMLQSTDEPVTASRIVALTRQTHSQVHKQLQKLLAVGLIERTKIKPPGGKGQSWALTVSYTPKTQKLIDAMMRGLTKR